MLYLLSYFTFVKLPAGWNFVLFAIDCIYVFKFERLYFHFSYFFPHKLVEERNNYCEASLTISCECDMNGIEQEEVFKVQDHSKTEVTLLDLYSSCGAMSIGLCLGIDLFGLYFVTVSSIL